MFQIGDLVKSFTVNDYSGTTKEDSQLGLLIEEIRPPSLDLSHQRGGLDYPPAPSWIVLLDGRLVYWSSGNMMLIHRCTEQLDESG